MAQVGPRKWLSPWPLLTAEVELLAELPETMDVAVGLVDVKNTWIEPPELVASRIKAVLKHVSPERLSVTPDCGFSQTAHTSRWPSPRLWSRGPGSCGESWGPEPRRTSKAAIAWALPASRRPRFRHPKSWLVVKLATGDIEKENCQVVANFLCIGPIVLQSALTSERENREVARRPGVPQCLFKRIWILFVPILRE